MTNYDNSAEEKLDTLIDDITTIDSVLDDIKDSIKMLSGESNWHTVSGAVTVDTDIVDVGACIIKYIHYHCSVAGKEWRVQLDDGSKRNVCDPCTTTAGISLMTNLYLGSGDKLHLNEIADGATCYYVISYVEI